MTLREDQQEAFDKKRAETRSHLSESKKNPGQAILGLRTALFQESILGYAREGHMLKAQCKRLANRSTVVGNTVFAFNEEGICSVVDSGNAKVDFELLLQQNGVSSVMEAVSIPLEKAEMPKVAKPVVVEEKETAFTDEETPVEKVDLKKKPFKK